MKFCVKVNKYYVSRQIYEELEEDNPAVYLLFGLCNYIAGNDTLIQGRQILEDLKQGKLHEIPDYNVNEVANVENYTRTGKMKYDLTELAKDGIEIGELLSVLFKDVWHKTTKELNIAIDENTLALTDLILKIDAAMQEADPEIFGNNFAKLMKRYDWTDVETGYLKDKKMHTVTMNWLQERQERELQKVLEMDIMHYADEPSTQAIEDSDYPYHRRFLSHKFKDSQDYQEAYTKFMEYATRQEGLIIPKLGEYGKYIAINIHKFRPEQQKALFAIIRKLELIHEDMMHRKEVELPEMLATPEAMILWQKAMEAGWVNERFQPTLSLTKSAILAFEMANRLGIQDRWKVFEAFWQRKNMRSSYNNALSQRQSLKFQDDVKALFSTI